MLGIYITTHELSFPGTYLGKSSADTCARRFGMGTSSRVWLEATRSRPCIWRMRCTFGHPKLMMG
jgi:hypothetical protein